MECQNVGILEGGLEIEREMENTRVEFMDRSKWKLFVAANAYREFPGISTRVYQMRLNKINTEKNKVSTTKRKHLV